MPLLRSRRSSAVLGTLFVVIAAGCSAGGGERPSQDEVQESIKLGLTAVYLSDTEKSVYGAQAISFAFGELEFGEPMEKQIGFGEAARTVVPVKVRVAIQVTYADRAPRDVERGTDEVFFFYKDGFGKWQFKTGST